MRLSVKWDAGQVAAQEWLLTWPTSLIDSIDSSASEEATCTTVNACRAYVFGSPPWFGSRAVQLEGPRLALDASVGHVAGHGEA